MLSPPRPAAAPALRPLPPSPRLQMSQVHLLVFDECHHAHKGHPYNRIMQGFFHAMGPAGGCWTPGAGGRGHGHGQEPEGGEKKGALCQ